ncbi:MAG TPA: hypothetical protein VGS08_04785 [Candidatus Saccharimonadales bacterium]|nr:hypothetical protein [Candidatus Saccharimonadales bacterium]
MQETQPSPNETPSGGEPIPSLPMGLSAVAFPEIGTRGNYGEILPVRPQQALDQLNNFLGQLNEQGADIVTTLDVTVDTTPPGSMSLGTTGLRKFAVVRRNAELSEPTNDTTPDPQKA